jgi:hypothetical protein
MQPKSVGPPAQRLPPIVQLALPQGARQPRLGLTEWQSRKQVTDPRGRALKPRSQLV